ncbi:hypothetical protein BDR26DRAFT_919299 [Obelidium mucronatum]|nr:hypothetical protein BDR26DRAFT_919299 [Obelidium mucronatum]
MDHRHKPAAKPKHKRRRSDSESDSEFDSSRDADAKQRPKKEKKSKKSKKEKSKKHKTEAVDLLHKWMDDAAKEEFGRKETKDAAANEKSGKRDTEIPPTVPRPVSSTTKPSTTKHRPPMLPQRPEEYAKEQDQIRKVLDPLTGRTRLVKGTGEIIEEIVSKVRHQEINKQATKGDGAVYSNILHSIAKESG